MVRVAIIGASGYTGAEAVKILLRHDKAQLTYLTALPDECGPVAEVFGQFIGRCDLDIEPLDMNKLTELADVAFCCLPHKVSMGFVPKLLDAGLKVIDFSADYRIKDPALYEKFYQVAHTDTENLKKAAYGLPELFRDDIKGASLIANPGCFPTGMLLAAGPLLKTGLINTASIIDNAVTGSSGAGKNPSSKFHFPNMNENFFAYGIANHRHMPEMEQLAGRIADKDVNILFQPHVGAFDRGILSTVYCEPLKEITQKALTELYNEFYKAEPFVQVCSQPVELKSISGTNYCHVYPCLSKGRIVVFSVIDNLVKGASGQAIQNMNIIFGLKETMGLE